MIVFDFEGYLREKADKELADQNEAIERRNIRASVASGLYQSAQRFIERHSISVEVSRQSDIVRFSAIDEASLEIQVQDGPVFAIRAGSFDAKDGRGERPLYQKPISENDITAHVAEWLAQYMGT